ncbi:MAG: hypothetical protein JSR46_08430, partial [Verrucomicrobia bacterium]|nr:hypothetical protein [Verrucomicrobiota bacterium]
SVSATQALVNRLVDNNSIRSAKGHESWSIMMDMAFAHFSNKVVKGNWQAVDHEVKQVMVLIAYVAAATLFDASAYLLPVPGNQTLPIGQATIISSVNAMGYFTAMASAAILQKHTYMLVNPDVDPNKERTSLNMRRLASGVLLAGIAMGASASNRLLVSGGSAFGVVMSLATNEVVNKIFKTGQSTEDTTCKKIALLGFYGLTTVAADVAMGLILPSSVPWNAPNRYFGATTMGGVISTIKVSAKALLNHNRTKDKDLDEEALQRKNCIAKAQAIGAAIATVAVPTLAIVANHFPVLKSYPTVSLGIKLVQHNLTALAAQELHAAVTGVFKRSMVALAPVAVSLAGELIANHIDPKNGGWSVTGVAIATAASYLGMAVSNWLCPSDADGD